MGLTQNYIKCINGNLHQTIIAMWSMKEAVVTSRMMGINWEEK